jgi:hypothetical protein
MLLPCLLCSKQLWRTENGLANHVWHDHPECKTCMAHGRASQMQGDPAAAHCSRSVMAICALRLARTVLGGSDSDKGSISVIDAIYQE